MIDDIRWKFVAAVALVAMAVSVLSGGLSGIGFGVLAVRAIVGGAVFAILAAGLNLLVVRYFPELLESGNTGTVDTGTETDLPGGRIDITMPEVGPEHPYSDDGNQPDAYPENSRPAGDGENVVELETIPEESAGEDASLGDLDRFSGDFEEVSGGTGHKRSARSGPMDDHDPDEIAQAIQTVLKRDEKG